MSAQLRDTYGLFINGEFVPASDGGTFDTFNPATGERIATCAEATKEDVDAAVKAAWKAFPAWKAVEPSTRAKILLDIADRIDENAALLAVQMLALNDPGLTEKLDEDRARQAQKIKETQI